MWSTTCFALSGLGVAVFMSNQTNLVGVVFLSLAIFYFGVGIAAAIEENK